MINSIGGIPSLESMVGLGLNKQNSNISFGDVLAKSLQEINNTQKIAEKTQEEFLVGKSSLADAIVATQKADLSIQVAAQVRNHVTSAYQSIFNMQV